MLHFQKLAITTKILNGPFMLAVTACYKALPLTQAMPSLYNNNLPDSVMSHQGAGNKVLMFFTFSDYPYPSQISYKEKWVFYHCCLNQTSPQKIIQAERTKVSLLPLKVSNFQFYP